MSWSDAWRTQVRAALRAEVTAAGRAAGRSEGDIALALPLWARNDARPVCPLLPITPSPDVYVRAMRI